MKLSLLKEKNFSIYIFGKLISLVGSNMQQFALSLYVYALTGSAAIFATMLSVSILPRLLLSPFAGVFGDWFDRKKMIVRLDILNGIVLLVFAGLFTFTEGFSVAMIFALVIVLEITEVFYEAASTGIIPSIVSKDDMAQAQSLRSLVFSVGRLVSPIIGAALYSFFGLFIVLLINGVSFFLMGVLETMIHVPAHHRRPDTINRHTFFRDFKEGLNAIRDNRFLQSIISIGVVINFVFAPIFSVGILVLIIDVLEGSDFQYGLFQSIITFAMVIGPIIAANLLKKTDIAKVCFTGMFAATVVMALMGLLFSELIYGTFASRLSPFVLLLILAFGLGLFISIINITVGTLFAQVVPLHLMGRASTVMNLLVTISIPVGQVIFGVMFDHFPVYRVIMIGSSIVFIALLLVKNTLLASTKPNPNLPGKGAFAHEV